MTLEDVFTLIYCLLLFLSVNHAFIHPRLHSFSFLIMPDVLPPSLLLQEFNEFGSFAFGKGALCASELGILRKQRIKSFGVILIFSFAVLDRLHVIDCLPNVWMLDGRIVTCNFKDFLFF